MRSKSFAERIADVLIEDGLLLPNQLEEAVGIQQREGGRLLKILTDRQFVTDQDMTFSMGRCLNVPPINLAKLRIPEEIMSAIPRDMAKAKSDLGRWVVAAAQFQHGAATRAALDAAAATVTQDLATAKADAAALGG